MRVALVGKAGSGKSTLFSALTGREARPHEGKADLARVGVPDERLDWLSAHYRPKKTTAATVDYVDTPGLALDGKTERREGKTEGEILGEIRKADALAIVLGGFYPGSDPACDLKALLDEFALLDFTVLEGRRERIVKQIDKPLPKGEKEKQRAELAGVEAALAALEEGGGPGGGLREVAARYALLKFKPRLVVVNGGEGQAAAPPLPAAPEAVLLCAALEKDLALLDPAERPAFAREMGVAELALPRLIRLSYALLRLRTFFTVGEDEVRAWTIRAGENALAAAGTIHTDLARGFIRAEVAAFADHRELETMKAVKEKGKWRLEGREYVVQDGDILTIRFSV